MNRVLSRLAILILALVVFLPVPLRAQSAPQTNWIQATAYVVPKETAPQGEGYFALVEGLNGRLYIGTLNEGKGACLVEFNPKKKRMKTVVDTHKAIGTKVEGFPAQSKIHTRCNVGASGRIYLATKQGHMTNGAQRADYPGGYPLVYDPATSKTKVYPIPVPHQGIISITPDESRGVAYISTCSDERPDSTHFGILNLASGAFRDLMDCRHMYAFIVIDHLGRAYHPVLGGDVVRYDPRSDQVERLKQTLDGKPPAPESHLADEGGNLINWDIAPDGKTLYAVPLNANQLFSYDLTAAGDTLAGRSLGPLVPAAGAATNRITTDCRSMCVGPTGRVWVTITEVRDGVHWPHLVSYRPGDPAPRDHGLVAIRNPDYTKFVDKAGKPLPYHAGVFKTTDGITTTRYVTHGICEARDGSVYVLILHPLSVLHIAANQLK